MSGKICVEVLTPPWGGLYMYMVPEITTPIFSKRDRRAMDNLSSCKHTSYEEYEVEGVGRDSGRLVTIYKCLDCGMLSKNKCEVWCRPCGYLRPTDGYNPGKKAEFHQRTTYKVSKM